MRLMAEVVRGESSVGPLAIDGRTITFVARTRGVRIGRAHEGPGVHIGALHVRARPAHVEILDDSGRREVVRIHDVERTMMIAIAVATLVCSIAVRMVRARRTAGRTAR